MEGQGKTDRHRSVSAIKIFKMTAMAMFILLIAASFIYVVNGLFDVPHVNVPHIAGRLSDVSNVKYLRQDKLFTWDPVSYATYYIVEVNNAQFTVKANEWRCPEELDAALFRIKAVDASGKRGESGWSYCDVDSID